MKNPTKNLALLSGAVLFSLSNLSAVETDPVGFVSETFAAGSHLVSVPLFTSLASAGPVVSISGADVEVAGLPALATPHFLLVTSGTAVGSTSSVLSTSGDVATLESAIAGLAVSDTVKIIEHATLGGLQAAGTIPDGSTCTIYNSNGTSDVYSSFSNNWYDGDFDLSDGVIVFPGEGVAIGFSAGATLTFTGLVNVDELSVPFTAGAVNISGSLSPTAPVGAGSIGDSLSTLPDASTITLYSDDGTLTNLGTYTQFSGDWYDSEFNVTDISEAAPGAIVVGPSATANATLAPAYTPAP